MSNLYDNAPVEVPPLEIELRDYQQASIDAIYRWFETQTGNPLVVVPTGGGKSLILSAFIHRVWSEYPGERILMLTHVRELIAQNHAALLRCWPNAPAGIYSAGIGRREADAPIVFAGIQSVWRRAEKIGWADLVIVDEAHLIPSKGFGMYRAFLQDLRSINPKLKVIGLTATPFRTDSGSLHSGRDRLFHGVAYNVELVRLIQDGYLSPVTAKATNAEINTDGVAKQGGEFVARELEDRAIDQDNVGRAVEEVCQRAQDRRGWLLFCCGIRHANRVLDELRARHVVCEAVYGSTKKPERDQIVERYKAGHIRALVSVGVLTTGFDAPHVDLIALLRPTMSAGLYVQMVGRGLRLADGKTNCLVMDFGGNVMRHGPINEVNVREPGSSSDAAGTAPAKRCPECDELVAPAVRECPECGHEWPELEAARHDEKAAEVEIVAPPKPSIERWVIHSVEYSRHQKQGKPLPVMRVSYRCGFQQWANEWICFEHTGLARRKAESWWKGRYGKEPVPATVEEALVRIIDFREIQSPVELVVDTRGEWPDVKGVRFREPGEEDEEPPSRFSPPTQRTDVDPEDIPF